MIGTGATRKAGLYKLAFSGDDALDLPADRDAARRALAVARETGRWDAITRPGAVPWLFVLQPLTARQMLAWESLRDAHGNDISRSELGEATLVLVALVAIEGIPEVTGPFRRDGHPEFGTIAPAAALELIPRSALTSVVHELAAVITHREYDSDPK